MLMHNLYKVININRRKLYIDANKKFYSKIIYKKIKIR